MVPYFSLVAVLWRWLFNSLQHKILHFHLLSVISSDMRKEWKILLKQWKSVVPWLKNKESSNRYNRHLRVTVSATSTNSSKATPKTVVNLTSEQELRVRGTTDNSITVSTDNLYIRTDLTRSTSSQISEEFEENENLMMPLLRRTAMKI